MKNFTGVDDVPDIKKLLDDCFALKNDPLSNKNIGNNKTLGLIFLNPSFRTRMSTQKAAMNLGMQCMILNMQSDSWTLEFEDGAVMNGGSSEHIREAAAVISTYCDIVGIRSFPGLKDRKKDDSEFVLNQFMKYCTVPIISLESATRHPLQSLADLMTIRENQKEGKKPKVVLSWAPHVKPLPQAVANSFSEWMQKSDVEFVITHPPGFELSSAFAANTRIVYDQETAFRNADFIYIKNWSKYHDYGAMEHGSYDHWMPTIEHLHHAPDARIMHCLPVRRNVEIHEELLNSDRSLVIEQAHNRVFAAQAVLKNILEEHS